MKRRTKSKFSSIVDSEIGKGTVLYDQVNLFKCKIGRNCKIDSFVYIEGNVEIGNNCTVRALSFIPDGVKISNNVFIGPGVVFTNDKYPRVKSDRGAWKIPTTIVESFVAVGSGAVILPGLRIGKNALIGAGAVVTKNVPKNAIVVGNPAKAVGFRKAIGKSH